MLPDEIRKALAAPFPADQVGWKPQSVKGNRALAICYIDARNVMDRLDAVVGPMNWQDEYTPLPDGSVVCRLAVRCGDEWIPKADVGSPSEQPDGGDRLKAAFSDALKRAGVKWGIGRYLYDLPHQWCDYDPQKRQFVSPPRLPDWAIPKAQPKAAAPTPAKQPDDDRIALRAHAKEIEEADSLGELKIAFDAAKQDKRLTVEQKMDLAKLKDERKALLGTRTNTTPDPDGGGPEPAPGEMFPPAQNPKAMR